jgi:predicted kinase
VLSRDLKAQGYQGSELAASAPNIVSALLIWRILLSIEKRIGLDKRKPIVYLICGFIGAGKTTFAKKLEEKTGAVRITKDEWSIRFIGNDPTIDGYEEWDQKICELSRDVAFQLAEKGIDVIIDEGFWEKEQRDEMRRRTGTIGAQVVMYYVETPIETIRERVVERNNTLTKDSFKMSREMVDTYLMYWQPPGEDEDYILASEVK